ncbi:BTAD domain-containing putative transcriptional regulator [Streptomyces sp. BPTC-684]|uniref:AfsR/SARP family transcriptional regulator n=1 Tax=Streptomyces sp. BPTC-684 TaxID=3043734 RepID=UPI0024B1979D|nr:BTAD domain-containing putative transcriptional regulator [Streptomyces sp. BPTC-684]WHM40627.1 BTAD domain-containing putative transcriptional regulator [Streptomyces sp. BPTC-684]
MGIQSGGSVVGGGPPQQQATLAALALRAGHVVPLHELMSAVWGEAAPGSAVMILRTYVWRLRKILESGGCDPQALASVNDGYRLAVPPESVDAFRAEQLAADAARAREAGRHDEAAALLAEAVALWRGEPLAGVPGPFAEQQRSRLSELRRQLLEERFALDLLLGRHTQVIPELTAFIGEQPLRERPYGFLMRALYAAGRQGDALAVFGAAREVLAAELGLDPGPELRTLHQRILAGDAELVAPAQAPAASPSTREEAAEAGGAGPAYLPRPAQLPADIADFSGRAATLSALCEALADQDRTALAVATVSGMGGIGKSALALRVAHRVKEEFPDGQLYADLRGTGAEPADPGAVLASFLAALGVARQEVPGSVEDRARLFRTVLDGRRVLLLLDDARDTAQVKPLLPGAVHCAVVVTSRAHLAGVPSGTHVQLTEFTPAEALSLLRHVVGAHRIDQEEAAAVALVGACAHLPLAVRIVAARLAARPGWTVAYLLARLADERRRLSELRADDLAVSAVFELGYRQLTARQAMVFRSLAPVAWPSIGLSAAAAALGLGESESETLLEALVDAALLESPEAGRYRYHELGRDFALHLPRPDTAPPGEADFAVERRLLHHLLRMAAEAFHRMVPGDPVHSTISVVTAEPGEHRLATLAQARAWVVAEFDCAVHAVQLLVARGDSAEPDLLTVAADLLVALSSFGQDIPYGRMALTARALARVSAQHGNDHAAGRAHFICGNAALQATQLAQARADSQLAAEACRRAGDRAILQQAYNDLGVIAQFEQRYDDAAEHFDQALALARELGHRSGGLTTTLNAALARIRGGRADEALPACDEALSALREMADHHGIAHALCVRGQALHELDRLPDALADYAQCLEVCEAERIPGQRAQALYRYAETLRVLGRVESALDAAARAVSYFRTVPDRDRDRGYALLIHARISADAGHHGQALAHSREALEVFTRAGLPEAAQARLLVEEATGVMAM